MKLIRNCSKPRFSIFAKIRYGLLIGLLSCVALESQAQAQPRRRLVYVLLLDVNGIDPTYDPSNLDTAITLVMTEARVKFGDSVTVRFRPLRDSAIACRNVAEARDCDAVIVREGPFSEERIAGMLTWMPGANRHPTLNERRPKPPSGPHTCPIMTGLMRCRVSMKATIIKELVVHFHFPAAAHLSR